MKRVIKKLETGDHTFPIVLEQTVDNVGLYTPTDGGIGQLDTICNFVLLTNALNTTVILKDGMNTDKYSFLKGLTYVIYWGDGNSETFSVDGISHTHTYDVSDTTLPIEVTMLFTTPWGNHREVKTINIPSTDTVIFNPAIRTPEFLGYDTNVVTYINTSGVIICNGVQSRLTEMKKYGTFTYTTNITDSEGMLGIKGISEITGSIITYFIDRIKYMDDSDTGNTTISLYPELFTNGDIFNGVEYINEMLNIEMEPVVHQEVFHGITGDIEIQSDIFIERGKQAPFEFYYKMGEISNMKELEQNGNKFFTINNDDDFKL